ncbi:MAG: hypothetical protein COA58_01250 [Bacteroidetes bacterium]|nr:MAG: hypothetical protein COA58_01250 [Bacteroidota bacterium]
MVNQLKKVIFKGFEALWSRWYPKHPEVSLQDKNLKNCKVLAHRFDLLDKLPKNGVVAELGVEYGLFSKEILQRCEPYELYLIDTWPNKSIHEECLKNTSLGERSYIQKTSIEYLNSLEENVLDWIYIDTDHTYGTTKAELEAAAKVVKPNGFICGHDYTSISYGGLKRYGVVEAVNEFCVAYSYEFIYLTSETTRHISFALRKI